MSAKSEADKIAALLRELADIKRRAAELDRTDAAAVEENQLRIGRLARTLRRRRGRLEASLNREHTTTADRRIAGQIAGLWLLARGTELRTEYTGRQRTLISWPRRRFKTAHPQGISNVPLRGRAPRLASLIVRLAICTGMLAYSVHFLRQFAHLFAGTPIAP